MSSAIIEVPVELVEPNRYQQRHEFVQSEIVKLATSIDSSGLLQPVTLRPHPEKEGYYELIAGERRLRAHKHLGRETIKAIVYTEVDDAKLEEMALIENVQRADLLPIEEAEGYQRLLEKSGGDVALVEKKIGQTRDLIEGRIALLSLDTRVQQMVNRREVGLEQAAMLLSIEDGAEQFVLATAIKKTNMSISQLKGILQGKTTKKGNNPAAGGVKKISIKQVSPVVISLSDILDKVDYESIKDVEAARTLMRQLKLLAEQITGDVSAKLERRETALAGGQAAVAS